MADRPAHGLAVCVDFGSTFTKALLVDLADGRLVAAAEHRTTIDTSARSQSITRAIISLCQSLGLEVTAEGVERHEQLVWLLGYPAMHLQGYLLSAPVPEADLMTTLTSTPATPRPT